MTYSLSRDGDTIVVTSDVTNDDIETLRTQAQNAKTTIDEDIAALPTADNAAVKAIITRQLNREKKEINAILRTIQWVEQLQDKVQGGQTG